MCSEWVNYDKKKILEIEEKRAKDFKVKEDGTIEKDGIKFKKTGFMTHKSAKGSNGMRGIVTCSDPVRWRLSSGHSIARGADWLDEWDTVAIFGEPRQQETIVKYGGPYWKGDGTHLMPKRPPLSLSTQTEEQRDEKKVEREKKYFDLGPIEDKGKREVTTVDGSESLANDQYL